MKKRFYYYRDENRHPRVTVCLGEDEEGNIARGISICSLQDNPCKVIGRELAIRQMLRAFKKKESSNEIKSNNAFEVLTKTNAAFLFKSAYNPALIDYEQRIIG